MVFPNYISTFDNNINYRKSMYKVGYPNLTIINSNTNRTSYVPNDPNPVWVDLGLPSGTLWADRNVGATAPEEPGLYFAWGETTGYVDANERNEAFGLTSGFDQTSYDNGDGASLISDIEQGGDHDGAHIYFGRNWVTPTWGQCYELSANTNFTETVINGIRGGVFTSKLDSSKSIFMPFAGVYRGSSVLSDFNSRCFYITTTISNSDVNRFQVMLVDSTGIWWSVVNYRYDGMQIRAVQPPISE